MILLDRSTSNKNFRAFLWHAVFLALTTNFMDMDTVIPSMLLKAGGTSVHIGLVTAILLGGTSFFQLLFSGILTNYESKKKFLLAGINFRILALLVLGLILFQYNMMGHTIIMIMIFFFITIFSVSGAFANVSYVDILGKSLLKESRKQFFSLKQLISGIGIFISALIVREILKQFDHPYNYAILFSGAGLLLLIASLGFWKLKEAGIKTYIKKPVLQLFKSIPGEIRSNPNLKYYILLINSLGLGISLLPFLIVYAQDQFGLTGDQVGNYLLFRVSGMVLLGFFLYSISRYFIYKQVMVGSLITGSLIPLLALILIQYPEYYKYLFIMNGFFFTSYKVAQDGILVEISDENNRAFYTGITGASNIAILVFPIVAGVLINWTGYVFVFITVSLLIMISVIFAFKLDCTKKKEYETRFVEG